MIRKHAVFWFDVEKKKKKKIRERQKNGMEK
jgi:hypothetical protein